MFIFSFFKVWTTFQHKTSGNAQSAISAFPSLDEVEQPELSEAAWRAASGAILDDISTVSMTNALPPAFARLDCDQPEGMSAYGSDLVTANRVVPAAHVRSPSAASPRAKAKPTSRRRQAAMSLHIGPEASGVR